MGKYLLLFLGGFAVSFALTPLVRWLAIRVNAMDIPNERKVHDRPIPRLGGVAIFVAFTSMVFLAFSPFALVTHPFISIGKHWWRGYLSAACIIVALPWTSRMNGKSMTAPSPGSAVWPSSSRG